ncbi:MAG: O-antigen ligase family protein [Candidatus Falkowbacteria bacterium]
MSIILIILFLIFYTILAKIRLDWAVMFLIVALPSYLIRFKVFNIPFTLLEAMILISFTVWFFSSYKEIFSNIKNKLEIENWKLKISHRYPFDIELILLLIISFIATAVAGFSNESMGIWKAYFFEPILFFILIFNVFGKRLPPPPFANSGVAMTGCEKIIFPLAISAFFVSALAIFQKFTGLFIFNEFWANEETRRVVSFFGYPNAVGLYLGPISLLLTGWLFCQISKIQDTRYKIQKNFKSQITKIIFILFIILLSLFSIYFARSEGALIGVVAGLIVFGLLSGRKIRIATVVLILIFGTGIMIYQPARDYGIKKITLKDLSGEIRKQQWRETWDMLNDGRIITGAGLANYSNVIKPYHQEGIFFNFDDDPDFKRKIVIFDEKYKSQYWQPTEIYLYPHNIILNVWSELGIFGLMLFIWIVVKYFWLGIFNFQFSIFKQFPINKFLNIGLICAMIVILIHGLVDVPYFKNDLAVMFWIFIAMMGIINLNIKLCTTKN